MKKHFSVFGLYLSSSFYKVLGVIIISLGVQLALFYGQLSVLDGDPLVYYGAEELIKNSHIPIVFALSLFAVTLIMSIFLGSGAANTGYTLRRLRISEKQVYFNHLAVNFFLYCLLWLAEIVLLVFLMKLYASRAPEEILSNQTVALAFYRSDFMHLIFPMRDWLGLIRNLFWVVALASLAAFFAFMSRRKKLAVSMIIYTAVVAFACVTEEFEAGVNFMFAIGGLLMMISAIVRVCASDGKEEIHIADSPIADKGGADNEKAT